MNSTVSLVGLYSVYMYIRTCMYAFSRMICMYIYSGTPHSGHLDSSLNGARFAVPNTLFLHP